VVDTITFAAAAWLLTYLVHSSVLLGAAALVCRRFVKIAEPAWRIALTGAPVTAALQASWAWPNATSLRRLAAAPKPLPDALSSVLPLVLGVLLTIGALRIAAMLHARRSLARLIAGRTPLADDAILARVRELSRSAAIHVSTCTTIRTPIVVGRRELCLPPRALTELAPLELDAVLAHEIAHLERGDDIWLLFAAAIERALFVQPFNTVALRRIRMLSECACDDWALHSVGSPVALASALARVGTWLVGEPAPYLALGMAAGESIALARVRRILDPGVERLARPWRKSDSIIAAFTLAVVVLFVPGFTAHGIRYNVSAYDNAGPFSVSIEHGRVVAMTIDGMPVDDSRLETHGRRVRVHDDHDPDRVALELTLTSRGGFRWISRPARLTPQQ
jgi:beta-lactamase regulating signal transducer with metallopeptidase domain